MSGIDRDTNRIVRAWLDDGVTAFPDRLLDDVLTEVSATRQRRSWWPAWRFPQMNPALRIALAGAALAVAVLGGAYLLSQRNVGAPNPTAAPTSTAPANPTAPAAQAVLLPAVDAELQPGGYYNQSSAGGHDIKTIFTVGEGWTAHESWYIYRAPILTDGNGASIAPYVGTEISRVYADPCHRGTGTAVGPSVAELVAAFVDSPMHDGSPPSDITVSGFAGKELRIASDASLDPATCDDGHLQPWTNRWVVPGTKQVLWILDVNGTRVLLDASAEPGAAASDRAALDDALHLIQIEAS